MAKYQIWDKTSDVYTPAGEKLSAEIWKNRYSWINIEGVKMVIAGGVINGAFCMEYSSMKESYEKMGCDFSTCTTDEEVLARMEAFEIEQAEAAASTVSTEERTAAALEAMAAGQTTENAEALDVLLTGEE